MFGFEFYFLRVFKFRVFKFYFIFFRFMLLCGFIVFDFNFIRNDISIVFVLNMFGLGFNE